MLGRENIQQTVRLLLRNAFKHSDPELTKLFQELYAECPALFDRILPRTEHSLAESLGIDPANDGGEDGEVEIAKEEGLHQNVAVIGRLPAKYCHENRFPVREKDMDAAFARSLSMAYANDYDMPGIEEFHNATLQWAKKMAWTDR